MKYHVKIDLPVVKQLNKKMDPYQSRIIYNWLSEHIEGSRDPTVHGKPLTANLSGMWRYRVGKYRIVCVIRDNVALVIVIGIALRKAVYTGGELLRIQKRAEKYFK